MQIQTAVEEDVTHLDGIEQCTQCGHIWSDEGECHYHDCHHFAMEIEEDSISDESAESQAQTMPNYKIAH